MHMYYLSHNFFSGRALDALASNPGKRERERGGGGAGQGYFQSFHSTNPRFSIVSENMSLFNSLVYFHNFFRTLIGLFLSLRWSGPHVTLSYFFYLNSTVLPSFYLRMQIHHLPCTQACMSTYLSPRYLCTLHVRGNHGVVYHTH